MDHKKIGELGLKSTKVEMKSLGDKSQKIELYLAYGKSS